MAFKRYTLRVFIAVTIFLSLGITLLLYREQAVSRRDMKLATTKLDLPRSKRPYKNVILQTKLWRQEHWYSQTVEDLNNYTERLHCPVKECIFHYSTTTASASDALIFHQRDIPVKGKSGLFVLDVLQQKRTEQQLWILFEHESPVNLVVQNKNLSSYFNWTMTYSRVSEIMLPYFEAKPHPSEEKGVNHAIGKTKQVVFVASHCELLRDRYVAELEKYINVTVFGNCRHKYKLKGSECIRGSKQCATTMSQFKFFLAFENSFCLDYITEKYWENSLKAGLVPVVMGAKYDSVNAIAGSYIDVSDFQSIKDLADHLLYLDRNDTAYNEYFKWRQTSTVGSSDMFCRVCEELHNERHPKNNVYKDMTEFWSSKSWCSTYNGKIKELEKQIADSINRTDGFI